MKQIDHFTGTTRKQQSLKAGVALLLMGVMLACLPASVSAQVLKPFTQRTSDYSPDMPIYHIKGDYTLIGNTNLTLASYSDNAYNSDMIYVNVDPNMVNSSTAELTFSDEFGANPACSEVVYAGLYWSGRTTSEGMDLVITEAQYSTTDYTLNSGGGIGGYTLTITQSGNDRTFTFTKPGSDIVLTMTKEEEVQSGRPQWTRYSYYVYNTSNGAENQIDDHIPSSRWDDNDSDEHLASSLYITLPGTNYAITDLYWNNSVNRCYAIVKEIVTPAYIISKNKIKIRHANAPGYTEVEATPQDIYYATQEDYDYAYAAYAEVTDYVRQYGLGNYTIADLASEAGDGGSTGFFGCWGMVVVYENSKMKWRDITIFDGFANVRNNNIVDVPISGFKTVQVGDVNMKLGVIVSEGDVRNSGDAMKILKQGTTDEFVSLSHDLNLATNFFNSSISTGGNNRNPEYRNNSGIDIAMFELDNENNSIITNNQTSTHFQFTTNSDIYFPFCFVMGVDAYIPEAEALFGVMNLNEDDVTIDSETGNYLIEPGKEITFEVEVKNFGTEDIVNAKLEIPLPSTIVYYRAEVDYVYPGINIEGYFDAERYANGVVGWNIDYIPSGDPNQVYARVLLTVKVTDDCFVLASTDPECELAIEVNGTLEGTSYVNGVYFKKESFISGFADETGCQGNATRNDIKVVVNKENYVNNNCQNRDYTVRLVNVCGNEFDATNPIPFMDIYALYPQGSRFFNAESGVEYTEATGFPISLAGDNASSAALIHVQPTSIYSAACTSDLRFILDPDGDSFTTPTLTNSATYCLDAEADSLSSHITSTPPSDIYYRFYKEISNSAVAYVDIVPPTDVEGTLTYWVRQFKKDAIGCEDETFYGPITIEVVSPITFSSSKVSPSCIGEAVTITGTPEGGTWSWDETTLTGISVSGNVLTIDGTTAGTYAVTYTHNDPGTAGYNCTSTERTYVHQIASTTNAGTLEVDQTICQGAQIQPLQIVGHNGHVERWEWTTVSSSTQWDIIPNNTSSISTADLGELAEGTYYFKALVKDGNCAEAWTNVVTIEVTDATAPNPPTVTSPQYACIGTEYTIQPNNGDYQWYEQEIGGWPIKDANGNLANSVTITVTAEWITRYVSVVNDETGCVSNRAEVQVRPNLEPGQINNDGQRECDLNQTATTIGSYYDAEVYGGGTVEYQWYVQANGGTEQEISGATSATFTPSAYMGTEGEYIFIRKVRNYSTCDNWQQSRGSWRLVVGIPDASIEAVPGHATICQNGGVQLRLRVPASTAYSYQWYRDGIAITNATGHEYIATVPGRYTAQVTHRASGCSATTREEDAIEVKYDDAAPTASSATTTLNGCSIADAQDVPTYSNVADIEKSIADGGLGISISDTITPDNLLTLTHTETQTENPTGACYQLVRTYTVTDQCGFSTTFTHTINVVDNVAPVISTTAENNKDWGCNPTIVAPTFTVTDNCTENIGSENIRVTIDGPSHTGCSYTQIWTATYTDACGNAATPVSVTYTWTEDNVAPTIGDNNLNTTLTSTDCKFTLPDFTSEVRAISSDNCTAGEALEITQNVAAGTTYTPGTTPQTVTVTVTVKDACGNTSTKDIVVTIPAALTASATATPVLCNGGNGSVALTVSGGTAPYRYAWSNGATSEDLSSVSAGTYTVTVTDANGCTATASATVNQPAPLTASATATPVLCNGGNGSVALTVSGGTTPYRYAWSNGATTKDLSSVSVGTYTVTVTDANGCQVTASATVSQPAALTASATATPVLCNGGNGSVALTVSGGTTPYRYAWSNGATTKDLSSVPVGTYTVTVTDANGCQVTASATVSQPSALTASATATQVLCNGASNGSVELAVSGGTTPYSYAWSNGATSEDLSSVSVGTYTVTVTDANGCTATVSATVSQPSALSVSLTTGSETCAGNDGKINYTIEGGTANYTVELSGGNATQTATQTATGTNTFTGLKAGTYTVTVTDGNTCVATATATIEFNDNFTVSASNTAICSGETFTVTPASHPAKYSWAEPTATGITGAAAGTNASNISGTLTNTTTSETSITYTVTATTENGLCTVNSFDVVVTVYAPVTGGSIQKDFIVCNGLDSVVTLTNSVSGNGGVNGGYIWQSVSNGTATTIEGANGETYTPTPVDGTVQYQRVYTTGCGNQPSNVISVTYYGNVNPGTVVCSGEGNDCVTNYCYGSNINVTLSTSGISVESETTPTIQWQQSVNGGDWTNISNANATTYTYNNANFTEPIKFRYTIQLPSCDSVPSNNVHSIGVWALPVVSIADIATLCPSAASTDIKGTIVTTTTPNYTYYWSAEGGLTLPTNLPQPATSATSHTITGTFPTTNCNATYSASLYVVDGKGCKSNTATETFTVVDTEAPVISGTLATVNVNGCEVDAAPAAYTTVSALIEAGLTIEDNCGLQEEVTSAQTSTGSCPIVITRTYTVKDLCDNSTTVSQTININQADFTMPANGSKTVACIANATEPTAPEVRDACGNLLTPSTAVIGGTYDGCEGTKTYTYTYEDCAGLEYEWTYTYTIKHTTAPAEVDGPVSTSSTVECATDATAPTTLPVVKDVCGNTLTAPTPVVGGTYTDCEGTKTYTYTYVDCAGLEYEWTYTYTIKHTTAPAEVDGPVSTSSTVECATDATAPTTLPVVKDVCGNTLTAPTPVVGGTYTDCEGTKTYTYTYVDCAGLEYEWTYTYTIKHTTAPAEVDGPVSTSSTVECATDATAPTTLPVVKDVCGNTLTAPTPVEGGTYTDCEGTKTYTYTYEDCAGLTYVWTYTYTIEHTTLTFSGSINDVENVNACYSEEHKARLLTADQVKAMYRSSCSREITVSTNDEVVSSSDCNWKITRTYNISDGGCNTDSKTMSVSGSDQTAPDITCNENLTPNTDDGQPYATVTLSNPTYGDNCSATYSISYSPATPTNATATNASGQYPLGVTTVTYSVVDGCGNANSCSFTVTVGDDEHPEITCPPSKTVACETDTLPVLTTYAAFVAEGGTARDNDGINELSFRLSGYSKVGTCPTTITRTYYIEDIAGNSATCEQVITIKDSIAPVLAGTWPTNITGQDNCFANRNISGLKSDDAVKALYSDCSALTVTSSDAVTGDNCGWTVTRTYTITDACNNSVTNTMSVSGSDQTAPGITDPTLWPENITNKNSCFANADISGLYNDNQVKNLYKDCGAIIVTHIDSNVSTHDCDWTIMRIYTVKDECGNTVMPKPTMSVSGRDQTTPYIMPTVLDRTLTATGCEFIIPDMREEVRAISSDGCTDNSTLTVEQPSAGMQVYPQVIARDTNVIIRVTDACGNYSLKSVKITIPAKVVITATATPASICNGETAQLSTTVANVVGAASYVWEPATGLNSTTIYNPTTTLTATGAPETVTYTVQVTDANGCTATATTFVTVNPEVVINALADTVINSGTAVPAKFFTTPLTGGVMTYSWTRTNTDVVTGMDPTGIGNVPGATLYNNTNTAKTTTITVTPTFTANGISCVGATVSYTITVNPTVVMSDVANQAICHGSEIEPVTFGTTITDATSFVYNWVRTNTANVTGLTETGSGNIDATALYNETDQVQVTTFTVTPTYFNNGISSTGTPITFTITVNPKVVMNTVANQAICHGSEMAAVNFTTPITDGSVVYNWRRTNSNVVGLAMSGTGNIPATVLTNTTNTAQVDTITVTPVYTNNGNECTDESITFTITVNPKVVMNTVANQAICHGSEMAAVNFTTPITDGSVVYNWRRTNSNVVGLAMSGTGNIPATVLTNTTNTAQVDTIYVKPTYEANNNICDDDSVFFTITVNPKVVMNDVVDQAICHGSEIAAVNFTTPITDGSVVYNWSRDNNYIGGLAMSGTGNIAAATLTNTTNTAQTTTITVTPVYANNGKTCTDETITFTITVNPKVVMNDVVDQAICHGSEMAAVNFTTPITDGSVVYNWIRDNNNIGGLAMSGTGNIAAATLTNTTNTAQTTTITVTPVYANNGKTCTDETITFTITVNPKVVMNTVANQAICHNSAIAAVNFSSDLSGGDITYTWRRTNSNVVGLAMSGTGNIPATVLTNTTNTAQVDTIYVKPTYEANSNICDDDSVFFTITVNPKVVMNTVANQAICHGSEMAAVNFTTPITDGSVVYNWTRTNSNVVGLAMSGTGNIPATVLTNTTNTAQVDTITVTPVYTNNENTCTDETITFTITVNPKVVMNTVANQAICHNSAIAAVNFSSDLTGGDITYTWRRTNSNVVGLAMSGTGNIPATVLTNTTNTAQVDTIYVKPTYEANSNICDDDSVFFTITVNPKVVMNDVVDQAICHGSEMAAVNFTTPITDGSVVYNWTRTNNNIGGLDMSGAGNIPATVLTNTTNTAQVDTITVTPVYTNNENTCTDETITFTITVNPKVVMNDVVDQAICHGSEMAAVNFTTPITDGSVVYNWTRTNSNIGGLDMSGAGNIPATVLTNTTNIAQVDTITVTPVYTNNGNECTDESITFTITVNPEVVMNSVAGWTLCVGETSPEYVYTSTITDGTVTYEWRNNTPAIGLAAAGSGNLPSFVAANAMPANLIAEVKVAPTYTNNGISCQGDSINFFITVRPSITTPGNVEFTCPRDTTVVLSYSECEQFVNIGYPEFVNNMTGMDVVITNDAPAGNIFPEGTTIVTWTATDECGAALTCTQSVVIQFPSCGDSIVDFDGYRYSSVRIGCQCWTGENARSEHYSDGTPVDNFRYYNDSDSLENIYGKLYTWYTAVRVPEGDNNAEPSISTDPLGRPYVQGICPEGWALPTVDEYMLMIANSGDATHAKDGSNLYWLPGYEGQPPFSGFDAYGAGLYNGAHSRYEGLLGKTYFWTTLSSSGSETATTVEINYYCAEGLQTELSKGDGVSIRCIRKR